ncbi:MAG: shikimate dehydrogenase [Acidobacteriota bacterium]
MASAPHNWLCGSIREAEPAQVTAAIRKAGELVNCLEIRLDYLDPKSLSSEVLCGWVAESRVPLIFTFRKRENGGEFSGSTNLQLELWDRMADARPAFVDLEIETVEAGLHGDLSRLRRPSTQIIVSYHNFQETPENLEGIYRRLVSVQPDVVKLAAQAHRFSDNKRMLDVIAKARAEGRPIIALTMGETGLCTRILGPRLGALLTYGSLEEGKETAPGQISVHELEALYGLSAVDRDTRIYGVLGNPVGHSLSPHIHNPAFRLKGLNCRYLPLLVRELDDFGPYLRDFEGLSVTIPHKSGILRFVDERDWTVQHTGAANTVVRKAGGMVAYNTDLDGIREALAEPLAKGIESVVMLGCGGAARAAACVLRESGCKVTVLARDPSKAGRFADEFGFRSDLQQNAPRHRADLLVNATPVGMAPHSDATPIPQENLRYSYVFDMVYNPLETRLLREARPHSTVISGLDMFIGQAARQFELWTGVEAPRDLMRRIVVQRLTSQAEPRQVGTSEPFPS